ncbi:MAG TPA: NADH-quinone oxidoreductase subunit J [Candidatus Thermoplasmatota archaeon]|nr:NADH-quinone oxidoreductase subunit J [Candidatus Thermoplasmatota archaeon]
MVNVFGIEIGLHEVVFLILALISVFCAGMMLYVEENLHATVWLAGSLLAVAGIFLTLGAEFLASVQVLVYVGAVITLILFTVMLTIPHEVDIKDALAKIELPKGITIESVDDIQASIPGKTVLAGPYKGREATRLPVKKPPTYYGLAVEEEVK